MQSFGVWLKENLQKELVPFSIKYKIVHGNNTPDGQQNEKIGRRMAATKGINYDQMEAELRHSWKPGGCPQCGGLGNKADFSRCILCGGTGLQGMSPQQSQWWLAKHKELVALTKRSWNTWKDIHGIPQLKVAQDIMTAAKRAGVPNVEKGLDWGDDEESIYRAEYYQGHEADFYIGGLEGLLLRTAEMIFKKNGHTPGPWD